MGVARVGNIPDGMGSFDTSSINFVKKAKHVFEANCVRVSGVGYILNFR